MKAFSARHWLLISPWPSLNPSPTPSLFAKCWATAVQPGFVKRIGTILHAAPSRHPRMQLQQPNSADAGAKLSLPMSAWFPRRTSTRSRASQDPPTAVLPSRSPSIAPSSYEPTRLNADAISKYCAGRHLCPRLICPQCRACI